MSEDNKNEPEKGSTGEKPPKISLPNLEKILNELYDFRLNVIMDDVEISVKNDSKYSSVNKNSVYRKLHNSNFPVCSKMLNIL
jgi:hypothetical protein